MVFDLIMELSNVFVDEGFVKVVIFVYFMFFLFVCCVYSLMGYGCGIFCGSGWVWDCFYWFWC